MYIVSTSKKTVLSDFADLETKSTYAHANEEATDFQFNAQRRVFVEVNKKAGLAVMRIKEKQQNAPELQRVRKLTIENAYSVGCAKSASNQIAIGQSSGCVKLFNFSSAQLIHRYPADQSGSTVLYVDYNCTDDYIAAVLDGGKINIYGTKTRLKVQTINVDDYSTLARFHPSKRFQLGIASYKGTVSVYDVQTNRSIFHLEDAHHAPCRDISMCSAQPSLLVSVGYDCMINIFDIRRNKAQAPSGRLTGENPMSTVALSECGTYFCAGNLKGELLAYDMRNNKAPLAVRAVHDGCTITRCAFVPMPSEDQQSYGSSSSNNVTIDAEPLPSDELRKSISANLLLTQQHLDTLSSNMAARQTRDSFCDFLDAQRPRGLDRMSTQLIKTASSRRDSFDWEMLQSKASNEEKLHSLNQTASMDSAASSTVESLQQTLSGPLLDRSNVSETKLKRIAEIDEHSSVANDSVGSDKECPQMADVEKKHRLRMLSSSRNSTPHHVPVAGSQVDALQLQPQQLLPQTSSNLSSNTSLQEERAQLQEERAQLQEERAQLQEVRAQLQEDRAKLQKERDEFHKEQEDQRKRLEERLTHLESELKWSDDRARRLIINEIKKYWQRQQPKTNDIKSALQLLLRTEHVVNEFHALKLENELLEAQVEDLMRQRAANNA